MLAVRRIGQHNGGTSPNPVLGVRVSASLRVAMARFCRARGLKMGEFVETAIRERMARMDQVGGGSVGRLTEPSPDEVRKALDELTDLIKRLWRGPGGAPGEMVGAIREQREKTG